MFDSHRSGYAQCGFETATVSACTAVSQSCALGLNLLNKPSKQSFGRLRALKLPLARQVALLIAFVGHSIFLIKI